MSDLGGQAFRQERFILGGTAHLDGSPLRFMHQLGNPGVPFHGPPASGGSLGEAAAAQRRAGGEAEPAMQTYHIQVRGERARARVRRVRCGVRRRGLPRVTSRRARRRRGARSRLSRTSP